MTSSGCCWPGKQLPARDRRVLSAVAKQAAGLVRQRELTEEAGKAEAIAQADELRRSLLSAVSHDLRTPLAAAKAAVSSLRSDDVGFSPEDTAELLATVEESDRPAHRAGRQSARLVAAGGRSGATRPAPGVPGGDGAARPARNQQGHHWVSVGAGLDRVKVEVGDAVAMADGGLLERVLANLIDNALRYAPDGPVRVNAGRVGDRVLIAVARRGPRHPARQPRSRCSNRSSGSAISDTSTGVGLGLSVARGFVEAMGGTVTATDTPGGGLTVEIDLAAPAKDPAS